MASGAARLRAEERELTEQRAGAELSHQVLLAAVVAGDLHLALDEDEERAPRVAFLHDALGFPETKGDAWRHDTKFEPARRDTVFHTDSSVTED